MGFYYGSSEPPEDDKPVSFRETLTIIWAAFSVLALPLGLIFGLFFGIVLLIWLFMVSRLVGGLAVLAILSGIAGYGLWEAKHPPKLG